MSWCFKWYKLGLANLGGQRSSGPTFGINAAPGILLGNWAALAGPLDLITIANIGISRFIHHLYLLEESFLHHWPLHLLGGSQEPLLFREVRGQHHELLYFEGIVRADLSERLGSSDAVCG